MFVRGMEAVPVGHDGETYEPVDGVLDVPRDLGVILCARYGYVEVEPPAPRKRATRDPRF